ncbi:MAG TPA: phosphotransferase family protein [Actinomycetota bacterium]|nr:phosphotransferase family protein [Actinomycetota bacterium]
MTQPAERLPPLVDEAALKEHLDAHFGVSHELSVQRHQAGHSNETFFVRYGTDELVLRRPPSGAFLPTAHDVSREYRVLQALDSTAVRSPRTVLMCDDESVIGAPFYLMERVDGFVIRSELPERFDEKAGSRLGEEMIDALVELHDVDFEACGLGDFGKKDGYLERQLRRWSGQLELTLPMTRPVPELERLGDWLRDNRPHSPQTTLVHGDYKLDNVVFTRDERVKLVAILDWEMSTLGDPLADLGWMASFWLEAGEGDDDVLADLNRVTRLEGFSTRADPIRRYEDRTGRDASALDWYRVLATWKLAILLEGSYARHLAGMTDDPFFARMERGVPALARRGLAIAAGITA